ncbi:peptide-methionine (S)-S-oxide reductase MsrA [Azoarcus sp. KH32C]|uniref:peptide-methionine (S)-S-oxide reductase MsrA n=1 Tax=Azoarcus sp. KH32C TaxID=748247 RepID=UPI0002386362|nr:peptide-methionine (S)-S-oxide reductase MsrA [Azoarcus sp. KH32C]BAL22513.1 peptide-methionine (S)-S-oxide reductase [Azoarcus sp. KH32C]
MKARFAVVAGLALALSGGLAANITHGADAAAPSSASASAIFAGGCFWSMEAAFEKLPGVISAESGYTGGRTANPSYEDVSSGRTGHAEAVRVRFDPAKVSYPQLVDYFWHHIDPTVKDQQFCDHGPQYRTGIYFSDEAQHKAAEASRDALLKSGRFAQIRTEIVAAGPFYPAEEYHQDFVKKNPLRYEAYRIGCVRDARLAQVWGTK